MTPTAAPAADEWDEPPCVCEGVDAEAEAKRGEINVRLEEVAEGKTA